MAIDGPVFHVPSLPRHLAKAPHRHQRRPPLPFVGYDMRTLRRQAESMSEEAEELVEEQMALYRQNSELWRFLMALREAHRRNGKLMRNQLGALRADVSALNEERITLRERLLAAHGADDELERLSARSEEAKALIASERELLLQTAASLRAAEDEQDLLAARLEEERRRLETQRERVRELAEEAEEETRADLADDFFRSSPAVLRAEFRRLVSVLAGRARLSRASATALSLRRQTLLRRCWRGWGRWVAMARVSRRNVLSRSLETKVLVLSRWRVFVALERLFRRARTRRLQRKGWGVLRANLLESRLTRWADEIRVRFQRRKLLLTFFRAWKGDCLFLGWASARTKKQERVALRHFVSKLLGVWHRSAVLSKSHSQRLIHSVALSKLSRLLRLWRNLYVFRSRCRVRLMRSFFNKIRMSMTRTEKGTDRIQSAIRLCIELKKLAALRRWRGALVKRSVQISEKSRVSVGAVCLKLKRRGFLLLSYFAPLRKRIMWANSLGSRHRLRNVVRIWRSRAAQRALSRKGRRERRLRLTFDAWISFSLMQRRFQRINIAAAKMSAVGISRRLRTLFSKWLHQVQKSKALQSRATSVERRFRRLEVGRWLSSWRNAVARILFWKGKELTLQRARSQALLLVKTDQLSYLSDEREHMLQIGRELVHALSELQGSSSVVSKEVDELRLKLNDVRSIKDQLESSLNDLAEDHGQVKAERERLRSLEVMLDQDRRRDELAMARRKEQAEQIVRKLQLESAILQDEVLQARDQSYFVERAAMQDVNKDMNILSQTREASQQVQAMLKERKEYLVELERNLDGLKGDITKIRFRIHETSREGALLLEESERELRQKSIRLNDLNIRKSQSRARVLALREIVSEKRKALEAAHIQRTLLQESRCMMTIRFVINVV